MSKVVVWDAGVERGDEQYTVMINKTFLITGIHPDNPDYVDEKNIQVLSSDEVNEKWMDSRYKRVDIKSLPEIVINAIKSKMHKLVVCI